MHARASALISALPAACLAVVLGWATPAIAAPATADDEFTSRGFVMPVGSALAYHGKSTLDQADARGPATAEELIAPKQAAAAG